MREEGRGSYDNATKPLITILTRLIKKIKVQSVLRIVKPFIVNSVVCYCDVCRMMYDEHSGRTRYRSIVLPKINKSIAPKNAYFVAIKYFNKLPNDLKNILCDKKVLKKKSVK